MDHEASMQLQEEMQKDFATMVDWWRREGYSAADVAEALLALSMAQVEMIVANGETEAVIARARATVERPS